MTAALREPTQPRQPPHNYEAEQALLGAILVRNAAWERVADFLRPEHFGDPIHGKIYQALSQIIFKGRIANPVTLKAFFESDGQLAEIGGPKYLARLANSAVTVINAADYGRIVHDLFLRREMIRVGEELVNDAYGANVDEDAGAVMERAEGALYGLAERGHTDGAEPAATYVTRALDRVEAAHRQEVRHLGVMTGLDELDRVLGGLQKGELSILAGRPSMGKSDLALNIAYNAARAGRQTGFFSLEMPGDSLMHRILARLTGIPAQKQRFGPLSDVAAEDLVQSGLPLQELPLFIDEFGDATPIRVRTQARRLKRKHGLDLIVIDYLQRLRSEKWVPSENDRLTQIVQALKSMAVDLNVPVLLLSQLSREVEKRDSKRPNLADLRGSGAIEQDADVVMFVYREAYYLERNRPKDTGPHSAVYADWEADLDRCRHTMEVLIQKQRNGPLADVKLFYDAAGSRVDNAGARPIVHDPQAQMTYDDEVLDG